MLHMHVSDDSNITTAVKYETQRSVSVPILPLYLPVLFRFEAGEDVEVVFLQDAERGAEMMVFQYGLVIVQQRHIGPA